MKAYSHYISLGYFCGPAIDLEKLGLRNASYPFDWNTTDFSNVIKLIDNGFDGFLEYDNLSQSTLKRRHYRDEKYYFDFYHDFNAYDSLENQFNDVKEKYNRRIKNFYHSIQEPTLFIRYISSINVKDHKSDELIWIEKNYQTILNTLRKYNSNNDIIFISNDELKSDLIKIYPVQKTEGHRICTTPLYSNKELYDWFSNIEYPQKENNLKIYEEKSIKNRKITIQFFQKLNYFLKLNSIPNIITVKLTNFNVSFYLVDCSIPSFDK